MNNIHIRTARPIDVPAIFVVRTAVVHNHLTESQLAQRGITQESVRQSLNNGSAIGWCAETEQRIVGFSLVDTTERHITALFVLPHYERRNLGSLLLERASRSLLAIDSQPVWLYTDPTTPSFEFYLKRGWQQHDPMADPSTNNGDVLMQFTPKEWNER